MTGPLWPRRTLHFLAGSIISCRSRVSGASSSLSERELMTVTRGADSTATATASSARFGVGEDRQADDGVSMRRESFFTPNPDPESDTKAGGSGVGVLLEP